MADQQTEGRMTKSRLVEAVSQESGLTKKQVNAVIDSLDHIVAQQLGRQGEISVPGLVKLTVVVKPATPERQGINPFTKQPTVFKAKPARKVVKARVLKPLKDALAGG